MSTTGFQDKLQGLTGRALKRVQSLTGAEVSESDNIQLIFAVAYVAALHPEQIKNWSKAEQAGWDEYLDNTSYAAARVAAGVVEEDSDPKDAPAN
ncbi:MULTISPECIES: hypothetical protein [unclassified Rhodococcus (in: high G+C Gram-positive bacteria)]|uniref:hypothetical protein n=1 Tax=unclassified Rhodococcus (in: high G+C Gram-positive bacteria) TaxID=192944 RepID=UPI000B9A9D47|nr:MULTISPECIES: hypothetical protein [unclassified Rhodococcus (in: high G+C Gram-positive bacteria)]OZE37086.1 hypothetical protein CH259_09050 [Rhodococcus sp. 05-2254-4]OZE44855.1 hypothetical protein CH261_14845 [Rhodococcus sp. 05-2254-3]OZE45212.1 hypothetical protein CH283_22680 [Rhodococcus sp. 05-2254-2]